eukprot:gene27404-30284_t
MPSLPRMAAPSPSGAADPCHYRARCRRIAAAARSSSACVPQGRGW